jgi:predicted DNA-binding transcriptional regulator YafY
VSERTARRDLDALGVAGIPVYASRERGGGWELFGGARTDLSGLTAAEAAAAAIVVDPGSWGNTALADACCAGRAAAHDR